MKRPAFQFYPADWRNNAKLRRCSWAARGVWIEVMGLMHDSDEYGVLRWTLREIGNAVGASTRDINELVAKGVLYGCASGECEPMIYQAKHGRGLGEAVELIAAQTGPIWYSPRMVRDEYVRTKRGASTRFGDDNGDAPKPPFGDDFGASPKSDPSHRQGDGASSSSSSSLTLGNASESLEASIPTASPSLSLVKRLRAESKMLDANPSRVELIDLLAEGHGEQLIVDTALELRAARGSPPNVKYLVATVRGRAADMQRSRVDKPVTARPTATDSFAGRKYSETPDDNLPEEFRDAVAHLA